MRIRYTQKRRGLLGGLGYSFDVLYENGGGEYTKEFDTAIYSDGSLFFPSVEVNGQVYPGPVISDPVQVASTTQAIVQNGGAIMAPTGEVLVSPVPVASSTNFSFGWINPLTLEPLQPGENPVTGLPYASPQVNALPVIPFPEPSPEPVPLPASTAPVPVSTPMPPPLLTPVTGIIAPIAPPTAGVPSPTAAGSEALPPAVPKPTAAGTSWFDGSTDLFGYQIPNKALALGGAFAGILFLGGSGKKGFSF